MWNNADLVTKTWCETYSVIVLSHWEYQAVSSLQSNSCACLVVRFAPGDVFCFDVLHCSQMNGHMESQRGRGVGGWGGFGHVKRHLWGFGGPLNDGRGSASGGSNFSKPWGGALRSGLVCSWAVSVCTSVCVGILQKVKLLWLINWLVAVFVPVCAFFLIVDQKEHLLNTYCVFVDTQAYLSNSNGF